VFTMISGTTPMQSQHGPHEKSPAVKSIGEHLAMITLSNNQAPAAR